MVGYEIARNIALGLNPYPQDPAQSAGTETAKSVQSALKSEMMVQFLERSIEIPSKLIQAKQILSLFDEYSNDKKQSIQLLLELNKICIDGDTDRLNEFLHAHPVSQWLSFAFIEDKQLNDYLHDAIAKYDQDTKALLSTHIEQEINKLVDFKELFECLVEELNEEQA